MRVLLTTFTLIRGGMDLYVRDVALELKRQGHMPVIYAAQKGPVAEDLTSNDIPVVTSLKHIGFTPDIIHGNTRIETMAAVLSFPSVPAIYVCHDHTAWDTKPWKHDRIRLYLGMSQVCVNRLRDEGMPADRIQLSWNFVDTNRFMERPPLPSIPCKALVFSNYAKAGTHLPAITEACRIAGLDLDVVGSGVGKATAMPEKMLGNYDIVFAKAKAAMEAMAVGCSVILADFGGIGPIVTSSNFDRLRPMNFGFEALTNPHTPEAVLEQIKQYNAADASKVRDLIRSRNNLTASVSELTGIYTKVIAESGIISNRRPSLSDILLLKHNAVKEKILISWLNIPVQKRDNIAANPVIRILKNSAYRIAFGRRP